MLKIFSSSDLTFAKKKTKKDKKLLLCSTLDIPLKPRNHTSFLQYISTTLIYLRWLTFCCEIYFSKRLRSTTSDPYCPTVPLSTSRKCVWWLFSLKPLEIGQVTEWYGLVVCTKMKTNYMKYGLICYGK